MDSTKFRQLQIRAAFDEQWEATTASLNEELKELADSKKEVFYKFYLLGREDELRELNRHAEQKAA
jgi:hypothetical protein